MLPLAIAPLSYGFFLEKFPAKHGLIASCLIMASCHISFALITDISQAIIIRAIEGMTLPVMLTSIMTLLTRTTQKEKLQQTLSIFIALTIVGGLSGRTASILFTEYVSWRGTFIILAILSLLALKPLLSLPNHKPKHQQTIKSSHLIECLTHPTNRYLYPFILLQFFTMVAILNFIPFRILETFNQNSYWPVLLVYSFYIAAIGTALITIKMRKSFNHLQVYGGLSWLIICCIGLWCFSFNHILMYCLGFTLVCGAIFANHSICSTEVNQNEEKYSGLANGTYLTFYYTGGTLGSILPSVWIEQTGWNTTLLYLTVCCMASAILLICYKRATTKHLLQQNHERF